VEAASDLQNASTGEPTDLLHAVKTAATYPGVDVVSMSWGIGEVPKETNWDSYFSTPGVTFVAASGDSGAGTIWPAVSPNVVSVGGTTLNLTKSNTIASETGWGYGLWSSYFGGSGGGFSQYESLPSYQANAGISKLYTQFGVRLSPDVAYVADPNTGSRDLAGGRDPLLELGQLLGARQIVVKQQEARWATSVMRTTTSLALCSMKSINDPGLGRSPGASAPLSRQATATYSGAHLIVPRRRCITRPLHWPPCRLWPISRPSLLIWPWPVRWLRGTALRKVAPSPLLAARGIKAPAYAKARLGISRMTSHPKDPLGKRPKSLRSRHCRPR